ncbi:MAG: hypothetical protein ACK5Z5_04545 [Neisseriaceae bacterium]
MNKIGSIEIRITGSQGSLELTPEHYDIREIKDMLENVEKLIYSGDKKERPTITYQLESGSVRHIFKTSMQYVIAFNAIIGQISATGSIDFLNLPTSQAIEHIQDIAYKKGYDFDIKTSLDASNVVHINKSTKFLLPKNTLIDAEFYFYGKIIDAGGAKTANIHLATEEFGKLTIETPQDFLAKYENNFLYRNFGIRATGKQRMDTGEIERSSLKFLGLIDYNPAYDEAYLKSLRDKARKSWSSIKNPDAWLREMRGGYDL